MMIPLSELISEHDVRPRGIVHVGAHEGQELESYLENEIPRVVWIEPNPFYFSRLEQRLMPHPHHRAYHFAPHDEDGKILELNVMERGSTLKKVRSSNGVVQKIHVGSRRLESFFHSADLDVSSFNFLYVDTEGTELETLRGAEDILSHFDYIYTDLNSTQHCFDGKFVAEEMDLYLSRFGFVRRTTRLGEALYLRLH